MKVALIGTLHENNTGPSRVTRGLAGGIDHDIDVFYTGDEDQSGEQHIETNGSVVDRIVKIGRLHLDDYDLVHALEHVPQPTDVRTVQWTSGEWIRYRYARSQFGGVRSLAGDLLMNVVGAQSSLRSQYTVASSPITRQQMRNHWFQKPDDVIPLGIEERHLTPPSRDDKGVIVVGRINEKKGQHRVADVDGIKIIGGMDHPHFWKDDWDKKRLGFIPDDELMNIYDKSRIVVVSSVHENFSMVALEAMAHGCAVVTTDMVGLGQFSWATDVNGVYVTDDMPQKIMELREKTLMRPRKNAYRVASSLKWDIIGDEYEEIYLNIRKQNVS
jgi:glycosyltransferase involved in cell wall biosynthesis